MDLDVLVGKPLGGTPVHELLQVKVQVLEDEEEFPLTVQDFDETAEREHAFHKRQWTLYIYRQKSSNLTMLGWLSSRRREISLIAVDGTPSHSL